MIHLVAFPPFCLARETTLLLPVCVPAIQVYSRERSALKGKHLLPKGVDLFHEGVTKHFFGITAPERVLKEDMAVLIVFFFFLLLLLLFFYFV